MCGRFAMDQETNDLIEEFVLDGNDYRDWTISYSIAPTDTVPIIRERTHPDTGEIVRTVESAVWDFRPPFVTRSTRPQINARLETVARNGLWKSAFAGGRCIVPMRGYYEWTGEAGHKRPWFLHASSEGAAPGVAAPGGAARMLAAAGLATAREVEGSWQVSTAIITTAGRDASGEIHDRMPVFLTPELYERWLDPRRLDTDAAKEELVALAEASGAAVAARIVAHEVDRRVNNSRTADPADPRLIAPIAPPA